MLNGGDTITPALEEVIDRIARNFDGFFFGRFDIPVPSREDFMAGRNLKIVELNGVTSEATLRPQDQPLGRLPCVVQAMADRFRDWKSQPCAGH
ncbi:MAG: hypothetical protein ACXVZH_00440 [Terriglobales bacterium]